jgi:ankyrin repeat protein
MKKSSFAYFIHGLLFFSFYIFFFYPSASWCADNGSKTGEVDIWTAAELGDTAAIALHLSNGADINDRDRIGKTPLMRSLTYGDTASVSFLLSRGAELDAADRYCGMSALHYATRYGYPGIVKILVAKGADPKKKNSDGRDALALAVFHGHKEIAEYFIDTLKMDPETIVTPQEGDTLLMHAAKKGLYGMVKMLLSKGADKSRKSRTRMNAADYAASSKIVEVLDLLREKGEKTYDLTHASKLVYSAYTGDTEEINDAIDNGADPDVLYAIRAVHMSSGATDAISGLFMRMINTGIAMPEAVTPLAVAAAQGKSDAAKILISRGAKPDYVAQKGCHTPLMIAICFRNLDTARLLIESGADVNAKSTRNDTPLLLAVHVGGNEIVKLLLEKGADVTAADQYGKTAVRQAIETCNYEIIKLFKDKGVDIKKHLEADAENSNSILDGTIELENAEMLKYMIELGADVNFKSRFGVPLSKTVDYMTGYYAIAKILIDKGAKVTMPLGKDSYVVTGTITALSKAIENDFLEIVKLLIENGHKLNKTQIERSLRERYCPNVLEFLRELGLEMGRKISEAPWNLKGFPYELGKKIRRIYARQDGNNLNQPDELTEKAEKEDIDIKNSQGETSLLYIMRHSSYENIARLLIDHGASVNIATESWPTPLVRAIRSKNFNFCEYLISKGANVNIMQPDKHYPLLEAIAAGDRKIYELLLKQGADAPSGTTEILDIVGSSRGAAKQNSLELLFDFAKMKKVPMADDLNTRNLILKCCNNSELKNFYENKMFGIDKIDTSTVALLLNEKNRESLIKVILVAGLIKMKDEDLYNAINKSPVLQSNENALQLAHLAIAAREGGFARYCLSLKPEMDFSEKSRLITSAMHSNDPDIIEIGLELMPADGLEQIYDQCAMAHGGDNSVQCLLSHARIEAVKKFMSKFPMLKRRYFRESLIYPALEKKNYDLLKYILDNLDCSERLHDENSKIAEWIADNNDEKFAKLLKTAGIDIAGQYGADLLQKYIQNGNFEKFKKEFEAGAGAEYLKTLKDDRLLSSAIYSGKIEFVKYLIGKGADIAKDDYADKALGCGHKQIAEYFVSLGAKYKKLDEAMRYAIDNEDYNMIDFLFSKGIDTSIQLYGETPAFRAVKKGDVALMKKLIEKGICLDIPPEKQEHGSGLGASELFHAGGMSSVRKQEEKSTLLTYAIDKRNRKMAELLAGHVRDINQTGCNGKCALELAISRGYTPVAMEIIMRNEFAPGLPGAQKALQLAIYADNAPVIRALINKGVKYEGIDKIETIKGTIERDGRGAALAAILFMSAAGGKPETIYKAALDSGSSSGEILFNAVRAGETGLIDYALQAGADVEYTSKDRKTPLYLAVESGDKTLAKKFLAHGANAKAKDPYERPLAILAAWNRNFEMVKLLAENGADLNAATQFGLTALYAALKRGDTETAEYLLSKKADMSKVLISAINGSEYSIVKFLLDNGADPNAPAGDEYPLGCAKKAGFSDIADLLKSRGANSDYEKRAAETAQIFNSLSQTDRKLDFIKILTPLPDMNLKDESGRTLLNVLFENYATSDSAISYAISRGADPNEIFPNGDTILMRLLGKGIELDENTLDRIKDPGVKNAEGKTAMFYTGKNLKAVELLKKKGLDIEHKDGDGNTALLYNAMQHNTAAIDALIKNGAEVKTRNAEGKNAIMLLVFYDDCREDVKKMIKFLKTAGIDINEADKSGNTALHLACEKDNREGVSLLLSLGADLDRKNREGQTPFTLSISKNYYNKCAPVLMQKGANVSIGEGPEGLKELMQCHNKSIFRTLIDKNIDKIPELDDNFVQSLLKSYWNDNALRAILQIAKKRGHKPEFLWKLIFEKFKGHDGRLSKCIIDNGSRELIDYLVSKGVKIENKNTYTTGLTIAVEAGNIDAVDYLLERSGKRTDENELKSVIMIMLDHGHIDASLSLLDRLGETAEIDIRREIFYKLSYHHCIENIIKLVNSEKNTAKRHDLIMKILDDANCKNNPDYFKSVVDAFDLASDSEAVEFIKKTGRF